MVLTRDEVQVFSCNSGKAAKVCGFIVYRWCAAPSLPTRMRKENGIHSNCKYLLDQSIPGDKTFHDLLTKLWQQVLLFQMSLISMKYIFDFFYAQAVPSDEVRKCQCSTS